MKMKKKGEAGDAEFWGVGAGCLVIGGKREGLSPMHLRPNFLPNGRESEPERKRESARDRKRGVTET